MSPMFCFVCDVFFILDFVLFYFNLPHYSVVVAQSPVASSGVVGVGREPLCAVLLSELSGRFGRICASPAFHSAGSYCDIRIVLSIISACWR